MPRRSIRERLEESGILQRGGRGGNGPGDTRRTPVFEVAPPPPARDDFADAIRPLVGITGDAFRRGLTDGDRPISVSPPPARPEFDYTIPRRLAEELPPSIMRRLRVSPVTAINSINDTVRVTPVAARTPGESSLTLEQLRAALDSLEASHIPGVPPARVSLDIPFAAVETDDSRPGVRLNSDFILPAAVWDGIPVDAQQRIIEIQRARGRGSDFWYDGRQPLPATHGWRGPNHTPAYGQAASWPPLAYENDVLVVARGGRAGGHTTSRRGPALTADARALYLNEYAAPQSDTGMEPEDL